MTVEVDDTVERYTISGVGPYAFSFRIFAETDLAVSACSIATPSVPTLLTYLTHYTVTGANDQDGGEVTLTSGAAATYAGYTLDIRSNTPQTQPTSIRNLGRFLPEIHEDAFDRLSRQVQDLARQVRASIRYPDNVLNDGAITPLAGWVSKYLTINASGVLEAALLSSTVMTASLINSLLSSSTSEQDNLLSLLMNRSDTSPALDSLRRSAVEIADGVTPVNYAYLTGDVRRYINGAAEQGRAWYCYGHAATYFSATQFYISGDFTSVYKSMTRVLALGNAGVTGNLLVLSSTFSAGVTNVFLVDDSVSPLPNPILAVSIQAASDARGPAISAYNANFYNGGQIIANLNTGSSAVARTTITTRTALGVSNCAVVLTAVPPTYTHDGGSGAGVYLTGGFSTQVGLAAPYAVLQSQVGCSLDIGTSDTSRIGIPHDGTAIVVKTDLTVNAGNGATNRSNLTINGLVDGRLAINSNSSEKGFLFADATEVTVGTNASLPFSIITGGFRRLTMPAGGLSNFANDAAAAIGGIPVGSMYRNGSILMIRVA